MLFLFFGMCELFDISMAEYLRSSDRLAAEGERKRSSGPPLRSAAASRSAHVPAAGCPLPLRGACEGSV